MKNTVVVLSAGRGDKTAEEFARYDRVLLMPTKVDLLPTLTLRSVTLAPLRTEIEIILSSRAISGEGMDQWLKGHHSDVR